MKYAIILAVFLFILAGCVDRESMKQEIKDELKEELKAELKTEIIQELEELGRLTTPRELISHREQDNVSEDDEGKEDWEIDYKTIEHREFENLDFALSKDPGRYVTVSLAFKHHRKYNRAFSNVLSKKNIILGEIGKLFADMTLADFEDPLTRERILPEQILSIVNKNMTRGEISEVIITSLVTR